MKRYVTRQKSLTVSDLEGSEIEIIKQVQAHAFHEISIVQAKKCGAVAPGFNSLIPAPSVSSLISAEPVELLCRTSNISSTDPFCFVKQKTGSG